MHRKVSCPGWWQTGTVQHWDGTKALSFPRGTNSPPDKSLQWIQELPRCQGDKRDEQQLCPGCSRHFLVSLISLRDWEKKIKRQRSSEIVVNWSLIESLLLLRLVPNESLQMQKQKPSSLISQLREMHPKWVVE